MDDLISRQEALEKVRAIQTYKLFADISLVDKAEVQTELMMLPPAQPEPKEGHWIPVHPIQSDDPGAYMCSKCKTGMWKIRPSAYHYCPNCGAKMTISTK